MLMNIPCGNPGTPSSPRLRRAMNVWACLRKLSTVCCCVGFKMPRVVSPHPSALPEPVHELRSSHHDTANGCRIWILLFEQRLQLLELGPRLTVNRSVRFAPLASQLPDACHLSRAQAQRALERIHCAINLLIRRHSAHRHHSALMGRHRSAGTRGAVPGNTR
jgi:hypothetical protein